jgi:hypothetical protein
MEKKVKWGIVKNKRDCFLIRKGKGVPALPVGAA